MNAPSEVELHADDFFSWTSSGDTGDIPCFQKGQVTLGERIRLHFVLKLGRKRGEISDIKFTYTTDLLV